jgi:hypothetical protein
MQARHNKLLLKSLPSEQVAMKPFSHTLVGTERVLSRPLLLPLAKSPAALQNPKNPDSHKSMNNNAS